jgi:hyperosmotically inducible protein
MKRVLLIIALLFAVNGCMSSNGSSQVGTYLSDTALTTKVKTALVDQKGLEGLSIHVNSYKGVVQLSGFVDTDVEKELAGQIARNVDGVAEVVNNLIVKP